MRLSIYAIVLIPTLAAARRLGGIDMDRACKDQYGDWWATVEGKETCNSWKCYPTTGYAIQRSIDTPRACVNQYGAGAYAQCAINAYDWSCFRN
jgi:hypothetical protein